MTSDGHRFKLSRLSRRSKLLERTRGVRFDTRHRGGGSSRPTHQRQRVQLARVHGLLQDLVRDV
eukprot:1194816-Prorocentrum_minimum.AAC.6